MVPKKYIAITLIGTVFICVAVALVILFWIPKYSCKPVSKQPPLDKSDPPNFASSNLTTLGSFNGYVHYEHSDPLYQRLRLIRVEVRVQDALNRIVEFICDCGKISMTLKSLGKDGYAISELRISQVELTKEETFCRLNRIGDAWFQLNKHYECHDADFYCYSYVGKDEYVARLHIDALKLELDGDPKKIANSQFSKESQECEKS